jgi:hypothetical protein
MNNDDVDVFNLYILDPIEDPNSRNIEQPTFSQGHDLQATLLQDGRIAFLRYHAFEGRDNLGIHTINSDDSNMSILYGFHSQETADSTVQTTFIDFMIQQTAVLLRYYKHASLPYWAVILFVFIH